MEKEFNLIDEAWICVRTADCTVKEVSLKEAVLNAHNYTELAGETKTQDFAVLRLILALMHTVFSRYNAAGENIQCGNPKEALDRWTDIWNLKHIPAEPMEEYFKKWHDSFWLFDEERPFYQVGSLEKGTFCSSFKMIGSISQSGNKVRIFKERSGDGQFLSYPEAARWLLNINGFDDIAAKKPTPKKAWLSQLGMICIKGDNLFETIMLNYVADANYWNDFHEEVQDVPLWERSEICEESNREIVIPNNQAELLTVRSRRIKLKRENGYVIGYNVAGGDYFSPENAFNEQMTIWVKYNADKNQGDVFVPMKHTPVRSAWQEFGVIAAFPDLKKENDSAHGIHTPGVISWINKLMKKSRIDRNYFVRIETAAVIYDYGQATSLPVIDVISDTITFHSKLFLESGAVWRDRINGEIEKCVKAERAVNYLCKNLQDERSQNDAKMQFYDRIDRPFRLWLAELDTEKDEDYLAKLEKELRDISLRLGNELAARVGDGVIFGRYIQVKDKKGKKDTKTIFSSAKALNIFSAQIKKIFVKAGE